MIQILAIAAGGSLGAVLRFWVANRVYAWVGRDFPYGTLAVNVIGSLLMGLLFVLFLNRIDLQPEWRAGILVGVLGAFTTFSTFSLETFTLLEQGRVVAALINITISVLACVTATWLGIVMGRQL